MKVKQVAFVLAAGALALAGQARANDAGTASDISLFDSKDVQFLVGGFAEFDAINDSTESFTEVVGNGAVKPNNAAGGVAGNEGRTEFSIRNSRFDFTAIGPVVNGWTDYGYMEFDLLGYDPQPETGSLNGNAGTSVKLPSGTVNSEGGFFDNATLRVRHMYAAAQNGGFKFVAGQTWGLLGFEPDYVLDTVSESPVRGDLYYRTPQLAAYYTAGTKTDPMMVTTALSIERPVQDTSEVPSGVAALRVNIPGWMGAYAGGSSSHVKLVPASFSVSGKVNTFDTPFSSTDLSKTSYTSGEAVAFSTLIPVIPASDKNFMSSLVLTGEFTSGSGDAEEYSSWSGGQSALVNSNTVGTIETPNLDAGFGGYYANNSFHLMNLQSFTLGSQYQLPASWATYLNAGYSQLYCDNLVALNGNAMSSLSSPYNLVTDWYVNTSHDWTKSLRSSLEFQHFTTTYLAKANGYAVDNRIMLSMFYLL